MLTPEHMAKFEKENFENARQRWIDSGLTKTKLLRKKTKRCHECREINYKRGIKKDCQICQVKADWEKGIYLNQDCQEPTDKDFGYWNWRLKIAGTGEDYDAQQIIDALK